VPISIARVCSGWAAGSLMCRSLSVRLWAHRALADRRRSAKPSDDLFGDLPGWRPHIDRQRILVRKRLLKCIDLALQQACRASGRSPMTIRR